jgi:hypothetical protein
MTNAAFRENLQAPNATLVTALFYGGDAPEAWLVVASTGAASGGDAVLVVDAATGEVYDFQQYMAMILTFRELGSYAGFLDARTPTYDYAFTLAVAHTKLAVRLDVGTIPFAAVNAVVTGPDGVPRSFAADPGPNASLQDTSGSIMIDGAKAGNYTVHLDMPLPGAMQRFTVSHCTNGLNLASGGFFQAVTACDDIDAVPGAATRPFFVDDLLGRP